VAPRHGLVQIAEALASVHSDAPKARLKVWGSGDGIEPLRQRVEELKLTESVQLPTKLLPISEMTRELGGIHIGVLASQLDPWTSNVLPNKLMEYAVMGIPLITFRNTTIERYFPEDAVTYVHPASPENLRDAMLRLIRDPEKARAQADRAREVMVGRTWRYQKQNYYDVLDRLAQRRG
jgi:glycosyltransferase involved in cell wall biosynthesis